MPKHNSYGRKKRRQNPAKLIGLLALLALWLAACIPTPLQAYLPPTATSSETPETDLAPSLTVPPQATAGIATETSTATVLPQGTPVDLAGTQVQLWYPWSGNSEIYLRALVEEFNGHNQWGIKVNATGWGSSAGVSEQMAGAARPDIVVAFPEQALGWQANSPLLVDLMPYINDPVLGFTAGDVVDYPKLFWAVDQAGSKQLGIPAQGSLVFLLYNTSWSKELGFSNPPSTPDEFRQQSCAAAKANQYSADATRHGTGGWLIDSGALPMFAWAAAFGGSLGPDASGQYHFNTPQSNQAFTFLNSLYTSGCAWKGLSPTPYDYFAQRNALFITVSMDELQDVDTALGRAHNPDGWTVLPFPSSLVKPFALVYGTSYYLLASIPKQQLAAWLFMRWISRPEQEIRLVTGSGTYPVRNTSINQLADYRSSHPQWAAALDLLAGAVPVPRQPSWQTAREIVQDAGWQLFQSNTQASQVTNILAQMDSLFSEVIQKTP